MKIKRLRHKFLFFGFLTLTALLCAVILTGIWGKDRKAKFEEVSDKSIETVKLTDKINDLNNSLIFNLFRFRMNRDPQLIFDAIQSYSESHGILLGLKGVGDDAKDAELVEDLHDAYATMGSILVDLAAYARQKDWPKMEQLFDQIVLAQSNLRATLTDLRVRRTVYLQKRFGTFQKMYDWTSDFSVGIAVVGLIAVLSLIAFYEFIFLRPLGEVSRALQNMSASEYQLEIPALYKDELGELNTALTRAWSEVRHRLQIESRLNQELRSLNQGLKNFSQIASHDLKEPLSAVLLYAELAEAEMGSDIDPQIKEHLQQIRLICLRMRSMIEGLLALFNANRKDVPMEEVSLDAVLDEALRNLKPTIEGRGALIIKPHDLPKTIGNSAQLVDLFQNLIGNGIKYNESDLPKISITVSRALKRGEPHIISVSDNGIGVPEEQRSNIFNLFERGSNKNNFKGTGVGLALCQKIVERHGGEIWVDANTNEGSTFSFSIPNAA